MIRVYILSFIILIVGVLVIGVFYYSYESSFGDNKIITKEFIVGGERVIINEQPPIEKVIFGANPVFRPEVKLQKWGDETWIKVWTDDPVENTANQVGNKIVSKSKDGKREYHMYSLPATEQIENGGFEYEIILNEKPISNKIVLNIETKNLVFFYQSVLTQQEIDDGMLRPENVVGSYAVYHNNKKNNEYKTGKAFHIYRPKIIDSTGTSVWGELNIIGNELTVTIPQSFLDNAVYPVRHAAGLTFGYTTIGASTSELGSNVIAGTAATLSVDGTLVSMSAHVSSGWISGEKVRCAIYNTDGTYTGKETAELSTGGAGWFNFTITDSLTADDYLLNIWCDSQIFISADSGSSGQVYDTTLGASYPNWPTIDGLSSTYIKSIYATYTEAASTGDSIPSIIIFE